VQILLVWFVYKFVGKSTLILEVKAIAILSETFCKAVFASGINLRENNEFEFPFNKVNRGYNSSVMMAIFSPFNRVNNII